MRTIAASDKAEQMLATTTPHLTGNRKADAKEIGRINKQIATTVATKLNNSPPQAFKSYIAPTIFKAWGNKHSVPPEWTSVLSPKP